MTRRPLVLLAASLLLSWSILAQQHPNQKKGFNASDVFQFGGLDHINTFNGNLVVTIPLGMSYPVGGGLSYGLTLVSNANGWEGEELCHYGNQDGVCATVGEGALPTLMHAHRRANAGFGWTVSLGRLYQPEHPAMRENTRWTYESPDGADHPFQSGDATTGVLTEDATYIRMKMDSSTGLRTLEFPNGEKHVFGPPETSDGHWVLKKITNAFSANFLQIEYVPTTRIDSGLTIKGLEWRLSDSHGRNHTIQFEEKDYDGVQRLLVTKIITRRFNNTTTALYSEVLFGYTRLVVNRGVYHTDDTWTPQMTAVQVLDSVTLADGSGYTFSYDTGNGAVAEGGALMSMIVPTGGEIRWEWGAYQKPPQSSLVTEPYLQYSSGVTARSIYDRAPAGQSVRPLLGRWTYTPVIDCEPALKACPSCPCAAFTYGTTTTTDPLNNKTVNYFSVAAISCCPTGFPPPSWPWVSIEYGQPMAKHKPDASNTRWLSSQFIPAGSTIPLRSTYARYESDQGKRWRRPSSRVVYEDDKIANVAVHLDSDSTGWDGFGHYRTVTTSSTVPNTPTRVATTNYLAPGAYWNTGLFDETTVVEDGKTLKTQYCFDATNGFLDRRRTIKSGTGAPGANDLIAVFTDDPYGNVAREEYYGGDGHTVGVGGLCTTATNTREYRIDHDYIAGSLKSSRYFDSANLPLGFLAVDQDIDSGTGLPHTSRDSAEVPTSFEYDSFGRLTWIKPTGRAWTNYVYPPAGGPFEIGQHQFPSGQMTGATLTSTRFGVDGLGRVKTEWVAMPDGHESRRETTYNALGWKTKVSELGEGITLPVTAFDYDALGRVIAATAPDGSQTTFSYTGARLKTRTATVATPLLAATPVTTKEQYDGYGRLIKIEEPSGPTTSTNPNGAAVTTEYFYDLADRLTSVTMRAPDGVTQHRLFDYDGRGFLRWESHPESAMTSYAYDSRGHVASKEQSAAVTLFDLHYSYDAAERLVRVEGRNPEYVPGDPDHPAFRAMKEFEFGTANGTVTKNGQPVDDLRKGKLTRAVRHNYVWLSGEVDYTVDDTYRYLDAAGRRTERITTFRGWGDFPQPTIVSTAMEYNELDLPRKIFYPMCASCGFPPAQDRSSMVYSYDHGRLKTITGFVTDVTYWPNGMRNVLAHQNEIADTQVVGNMPRPSSISFGTYDRCVRPNIEQHPASVSLPAGGGSATLSVTVSGTGPFEYRWYRTASGLTTDAGTTQSITVTETASASYYVWVIGPCGDVESHVAKVSVGQCPLPTTGAIQPVLQVDGSWILTPEPTAAQGATYEWRRLSDNAPMGAQMTLAVQPLTVTTTFRLTVTDSCGSGSSDVTIQVPLQISTGLTATWNGSAIVVRWPAVSGATLYQLQRRSGTAWEVVTEQSGTTYTDMAVVASRTYAYRVALATGNYGGIVGNFSNSDVATTGTFIEAIQYQNVTADVADEMLRAVNSVRAALGWPAVSWGNILAPSDPLPDPGSIVLARHVASCRARMDEALHALGVPVQTYVDPELKGVPMKARHINDIQQRSR